MPTTGTFRIQMGVIQSQSGITYYQLSSAGPVNAAPSDAQLREAMNEYPMAATHQYGYGHGYFSPTAGPHSASFRALPDSDGLFLDGATTPTLEIDIPPGFEAVTAKLILNHGGPGGYFDLEYDLWVGALSQHYVIDVGDDDAELAFPLPLTLNGIYATPVGIDFSGHWSASFLGPTIVGTYEIIASWWRLPETCAHSSELRFGGSPGLPYTPYDPDDSAAHPTPAALSVTPSHGTVAGGTPITIHG